jgi:hypothetical protein
MVRSFVADPTLAERAQETLRAANCSAELEPANDAAAPDTAPVQPNVAPVAR